MRAAAAVIAAVLAVGTAGCGGGDDDAAAPATTTTVGAGTTFAKRYTDATGAARDVDTRLTVVAQHPPPGTLPVALPAGRDAVIADVQLDDRGEDPFPLQWARFSATTTGGATVREAFRLAPRRVRDGVQIVPVGFAVTKGDDLQTLRVRSIVALWPFRARLPVPPAAS